MGDNMDSKLSVPEIQWNSFSTNDIADRLYTILLKWGGFANKYYKKWSVKENCGHYFGGAYVYEMESASAAIVGAILSTLGDYDAEITGITREEMQKRAISTIRYLCFTHTTGPDDCVRDKSHHEIYSGKKWGFIYNNFFRDSQTGVGISFIGLAAWLLWDKLDGETHKMVERLVISYADKYSGMIPGTGVYNDTQCEENAWTSLGISTALYMFPKHSQAKVWMDGYINWSLNSSVTFKDKLEKEWDKVSYQSRGGIPHNGKTYGISSVTFHPDFTTENHGYVHPDYMGAGIILKMSSVIFPLLVGAEPLESSMYNVENLYNRAIKPLCGMDGNPIPVQGQDWFYHRHANKLFMHASMNLLFNDPDAAYFEEQCLEVTEKRQDSTGLGALLEKNGKDLAVTPGLQSAFDMEGGTVRTIILAYLMHLTKGRGVMASTKDDVAGKLCGNHFYPYGGIYIHRTLDSLTSFATRCSVMGLSIPSDGLWGITSDFMGFTGLLRKSNAGDEYFAKKKINWMDLGIETENLKINEYKEGFSLFADIPRAGGDIRQSVSFSALPGGQSVYIEKITAINDIDIAVSDTGRISIGNENFEKIGERAKGSRKVWFNSLEQTFIASYEGVNQVMEYDNVKYINVDNIIGYLLFDSRGVEYINMHEYPKWKGLENILVCNKGKTGLINKGEAMPLFAMMSLPNTSFDDTKNIYSQTQVTFKDENCKIIRCGDYRISANLGELSCRAKEVISTYANLGINIFPGTTKLKKENSECIFDLVESNSCFHEAVIKIAAEEMSEEDSLEILCTETGKIWIHNTGSSKINYAIINNNDVRHVVQGTGEIIKI